MKGLFQKCSILLVSYRVPQNNRTKSNLSWLQNLLFEALLLCLQKLLYLRECIQSHRYILGSLLTNCRSMYYFLHIYKNLSKNTFLVFQRHVNYLTIFYLKTCFQFFFNSTMPHIKKCCFSCLKNYLFESDPNSFWVMNQVANARLEP